MKINDLRQKKPLTDVDELECGNWFVYYDQLYRVSDYDTDNTIPCVHQESGEQSEFSYGTEVIPVEVEINIIS